MSSVPVPYVGTGSQSQVVLGHYATAQASGLIAATPTALDVHASLRWAPSVSSYFLTLMRLKLGYNLAATIAAAVRITYQAVIVRAFSSDYTTAATALNLSSTTATNQMRRSMNQSQMGATGPRICTTAPQTVATFTADAAPFAMQTFSAVISTNSVGTVTIMQVGDGRPLMPLYEWTALGQHPVVLSNNEGIIIQLLHTGWGTSSAFTLYDQFEWGESLVF